MEICAAGALGLRALKAVPNAPCGYIACQFSRKLTDVTVREGGRLAASSRSGAHIHGAQARPGVNKTANRPAILQDSITKGWRSRASGSRTRASPVKAFCGSLQEIGIAVQIVAKAEGEEGDEQDVIGWRHRLELDQPGYQGGGQPAKDR